MKNTWLPDPADYPESRLFSLDALRGLDMLLLTVVGALLRAAQTSWNCFSPAFMGQLRHGWVCFTLWDIIMPLFIFMCGAAIPFALGRRLKEGKGVFWRHVIGRVVLLWVMGGLVQGNWLDFDWKTFSPFSNTLQSIAVGYLVVAAALAVGSRALMIALPVALAAGYTLLIVPGGYGEWTNLAYRIDQSVLRALLPADNTWIAKPNFYTWFLTSMMFAVMAFAGYHATQILRASWSKGRRAAALFGYGAALLAVGFVSEIWIPCIKPIYTLSFTAQAMGWCALALAVLFVVNDIWMIRSGFGLVLLFGQFALTAYFVAGFCRPVLVAGAHLVGDGAIALLPASAAAFGLRVLTTLELIAFLCCWRRWKQLGGFGR